ncbi:hypothetical protein CSOJ01_06197 [Colletotrichum sojae]|uniref:Uncharacterized protein n=1 Tax=Colletotrichum sojae TaxID=2175907 RepID=A0A8H6JCU1_9PEZI|nr:hypothetical protein CSOJ01_06197 [Colletotrichum sojae]
MPVVEFFGEGSATKGLTLRTRPSMCRHDLLGVGPRLLFVTLGGRSWESKASFRDGVVVEAVSGETLGAGESSGCSETGMEQRVFTFMQGKSTVAGSRLAWARARSPSVKLSSLPTVRASFEPRVLPDAERTSTLVVRTQEQAGRGGPDGFGIARDTYINYSYACSWHSQYSKQDAVA